MPQLFRLEVEILKILLIPLVSSLFTTVPICNDFFNMVQELLKQKAWELGLNTNISRVICKLVSS